MNTPDLAAMRTAAFDFTRQTIDRFGPRLAGSEADKQAAQAIHAEMQTFCDATRTQLFSVHPAAFLDWIRILVVIYVISLAAVWLNVSLIAALLVAAGLAIMVYEFFLYKEVVDPLFKKVTGTNVWGIVEPSGEVKQQVIISGHHDSARIFNFFIHQPKLYSLRVMGGIGTFVVFFLYTIVLLFTHANPLPLWQIILNSLFTLLLLLVGQLWFFASNQGTPGAGDNLIASALALQVGKYFQQQKRSGNPLQHTRLHIVSFDAEEAGLRGARAFFKEFGAQLRQPPAWLYNIDCPYNLQDTFFLTSDINGSVALSTEMAERCAAIAHELRYPAITKPITFLTGGTDAAEGAKAGLRAVTLMAMPWDNTERAAVYHTPDDNVDAIEPAAVEAAMAIAIGFIQQLDEA
jgi:aminopeptidase YwaD